MSEEEKPEAKRPLDPKAGAAILVGSFAVSWGATWLLSWLFPFGPRILEKLPFTVDSPGAWLVIGAWILFPTVFAAFFLRLAKGVDPMRVAMAFAGVTYFLQCWAELRARGSVSLWPELFFTAVPTFLLHARAARNAPKNQDAG